MGIAVGERADVVVVTSDNPRDDDPQEIADSVAAASRGAGRAEVLVELDRARAIERALELARPADVVVVAGKGHEPYQEIAGVKHLFDDAVHAANALAARKDRA